MDSETRHLQELMDRWRTGDRDAADALCRRVARRLEALSHKLLGGFPNVRPLADTDDVLQEALLRLLHSLTKLRPASTREFYNLAAVHLRRELLDLTRRVAARPDLRRRRSASGPDDRSADPLAELPDPAHAPEDLERWCRFHEAVEELPVAEREVINLTFYQGWTQKRIAELFQVDERTIRRWWGQAGDRLRRALDGQIPNLPGRP